MNGRGVLSSKNRGRFIATLEPRLDLIFAVSVLRYGQDISLQLRGAHSKASRKTCMRICNFLGKEETMAR